MATYPMIAKGQSISHTKNALSYAAEKLHARELARHDLAGDHAGDIAADFRIYQQGNQRCQKNTMQFVLSPSIEDGERLSDKEFRDITREFLTTMGLFNHQWIAYTHQDRAHKHVHIYVNRIDHSGKAFPDKFLSNRASQAAEKVAHKYNLTQASKVAKANRVQKVERLSEQIGFIKQIAQQVFGLDTPTTEQEFVEVFNRRAGGQVVRAEACYNKEEVFQGLRFFVSTQTGEAKLKGSDVDKNLSKKQLLLRFQSYQQKQTHEENRAKNIVRSRLKL